MTSARIPRLEFFGEGAGLIGFGISWLTASRVLPLLTRQDERFSAFNDRNPNRYAAVRRLLWNPMKRLIE
jgi:hypothetical protein